MNAAAKPELKPANDNPWYWLATLYGEWNKDSKELDQDIAQKNRIAWNRWFAKALSAEQRDKLQENGFSREELVPWTPKEEAELAIAFTTRSGRTDQSLPDPTRAIDFSHTIFDRNVCLIGFIFPNDANFKSVMFSGTADFESATFSGYPTFVSATFSGYAIFRSATFSRTAIFVSATFSGYANFQSATFWTANFESATFTGGANFNSTTFSELAYFNSTTFSGGADFKSATFSSHIDFINSEFTAKTIFAHAHFISEVPDFRGAKLHEATEWHGVRWPSAPTDKTKAQVQVYAYERLKQEMERLKKHEDELLFFRKELRARRVLVPFWTAAWWFNTLYAVLSGYGQSTWKPLVGLCVLFLLVGAVFVWVPEITGTSMTIPQAASVSFASIFAIFPMPKGIMALDVFDSLSSLAKIILVVEAFFGTLLLFLLGVALRNRFRMR